MILTSWRLLLSPPSSRPRALCNWTTYAEAAALESALVDVHNIELEHTQLERAIREQMALEAKQGPEKARLEIVW
jgi:hypothetical protein